VSFILTADVTVTTYGCLVLCAAAREFHFPASFCLQSKFYPVKNVFFSFRRKLYAIPLIYTTPEVNQVTCGCCLYANSNKYDKVC